MKNLKTFFALLSLVFISASATQAVIRTTEEKATEAFIQYQLSGSDSDLNDQIQKLNDQGYTRTGKTKAVVLRGGCGFAGCSYDYLVTTLRETVGVNTRTASVAAVVEARTFLEKGTVKKVLTEESLLGLVGE